MSKTVLNETENIAIKVNRTLRAKIKRLESDLTEAQVKIANLEAQLKEATSKEAKATPKKKATKKKVEAYYNLFDGKFKQFKNGLESVRKSLEVNLKKPTKEQLDKAVSELKKQGSLVVGKRTYYTQKGYEAVVNK